MKVNLIWEDFGLPADPFPELSGRVKFGGIGCKHPYMFACYNPDEIIYGKTMSEHLPFCGAAWHGKENPLSDQFGMPTSLPILPGAEGEEFAAYELRFRAFFYMLYLLGIKYWAWHDFDMVPKGNNLREFHANIDRMVPVILELQKLTGIKCGWTTQNLFSFPIYCEGAATSPFVGAYALAWAQTKKMLEVGKRIGARNHVFWGGREGYMKLLITLLKKERKNLARFLRMAVDYAKDIGFEAQFLIEPKPMEPTTRQYDASAEIVIGFLREFGLLEYFKLNLETNHALLAQLTMLHECIVAIGANLLGGIDANDGTFGDGWDTDEFLSNPITAFHIMYAILKAGGLGTGVINFDAHRRRGSFAPIDHIHAHILGMDTMALGLRTAAVVLEDGFLEQFIQQHYSSWKSELGERIESGEASFDQVAEAGYEVPFGVATWQSSHHEAVESVVLRAQMIAIRQAA